MSKNFDYVVDETDKALRYDKGKIRLDLIPHEWVWGLGEVLTKGVAIYTANNWKKGMDWSRILGSLLRHLYKFVRGERFDKETGCHHLDMVAWNALVLRYYDKHGVGVNDLTQERLYEEV